MYKNKSVTAVKTSESVKTAKLLLSILFDIIGMTPTVFPPLALLWAPFSALVLTTMYKGKTGRFAGLFDFAEELIPVVDFIPTFTLTWLYVYKIKGE
jgi:hypothetical protein